MSSVDELWADLQAQESRFSAYHALRLKQKYKHENRKTTAKEELHSCDNPDPIALSTPLSSQRSATDLLKEWSRDINYINDEDFAKRRDGLIHVKEGLDAALHLDETKESTLEGLPTEEKGKTSLSHYSSNKRSYNEATATNLFQALAKPLFKAMEDRRDVCRGLSIHCVTVLVKFTPDLTPHLGYLFPVLVAKGTPSGVGFDSDMKVFVHDIRNHEAYKRGKAIERQDRVFRTSENSHGIKVVEPSEELRLKLCILLREIVNGTVERGATNVLRPYFEDIILLLSCMLRDPFSSIKVEACGILQYLCRVTLLEAGMKTFSVALARELLPSLRHRHSKVRLGALQALQHVVMVPDRAKCKGAGTEAIADLVGFREANAIPIGAFYGRCDVSINFIAHLTADPSLLVREATIRYEHNSRLLPYILSFFNDERATESIKDEVTRVLVICGEEYVRDHKDEVLEMQQYGVEGDENTNYSKPLRLPFVNRPGLGERLRFLKPIVNELTNWVGGSLTADAHFLIPGLQKAIIVADHDAQWKLKDILLSCCELLGRFIPCDAWIGLVLPPLAGDTESSWTGSERSHTDNHRVWIAVIEQLCSGSKPSELIRHSGLLLEKITGSDASGGSGYFKRTILAIIQATLAILKSMKSLGGVEESRGKAVESQILAQTGRLASMKVIFKPIVQYVLTAKRASEIRPAPSQLLTDSTTSSSNIDPTLSLSQAEAKAALEICLSAQECLGLVWYLEGLSLARGSESYNYDGEKIVAAVVSLHIEWLLPYCLSNFPVRRKWDPLCPHQCLFEALCTESEAIESTYIADIVKWAQDTAMMVGEDYHLQIKEKDNETEIENRTTQNYSCGDDVQGPAVFEGCGRILFVLFAGGKERMVSMFNENEGPQILEKVLNLLAEPAWMQSDQLHDDHLDILSGLKDVFSQLDICTDILRRVVNALVYHIDDCTRLPNRRLLAINICSSLVLGKPGAEYNYNTGNTYSRMANNKTVQEGVGRTGDDNGSGLSMTSIEQEFHSALLRRLDDPSNDVCQCAARVLECLQLPRAI